MSELSAAVRNPVIWRYTAIAAVVSLVVNLIIYTISRSTGWIPDEIPSSMKAFSLASVMILSVIPILPFGVLMAVLSKKAPNASQLFTMVLLVATVIAVIFPFLLHDIDTSFRYVLVAMHLVTSGSILILTWATPK